MSKLIGLFFAYMQQNVIFTCIVVGIVLMTLLVSLAVIFHKIGQKWWKGLIPIYNIIFLLKVLNIPIWMIFLMFIPFANILGIPIMMFLIGWKLGSYCYKGLVIKLGLIICPILFFPILAATEIDINKPFEAQEIQVVKVEEKFKLDPVVVTSVDIAPSAMSLSDSGVLEQLEPPKKKRKIEIPVKENNGNKDFNSVPATQTSNEVEDLNRVLPTADDLTFDYNSLYVAGKKEEAPKVDVNETPQENIEEVKEEKEESTLDYESLYKEEVEEPTLPVIHDVVLESAEPITGDIGPIPINRRYDLQHKKKVEETVKEEETVKPKEEFVLPPVNIVPIQPTVVAPIDGVPTVAANPFADTNMPMMASAPDFNLPSAPVPTPVFEPAKPVQQVIEEPVIQVDQIVSMNIAEPEELPVGILVTDKKEEETKEEVKEETATPVENPGYDANMTLEEAMGFQKRTFGMAEQQPMMNNQPMQPQMGAQPNLTTIFQGNGNAPLLRPVENNVVANIDKVCPQCGFKVKQDCPICTMCGHRF